MVYLQVLIIAVQCVRKLSIFFTLKLCHNSKPHNKTENEINMGTLSWYEKGTSVTSLSERC